MFCAVQGGGFDVQQVHTEMLEHGAAQVGGYGKSLNALIPKMVAHDFWFFRSDKQQLTPNSESIRQAIMQTRSGPI